MLAFVFSIAADMPLLLFESYKNANIDMPM